MHCSNSMKNFVGSLFLLAAATGVQADCMICDEIVTLNAARADCFLENYEEITNKLSSVESGRVPVDLDECSVEGEALSRRAGLNTLPLVEGGSAEVATGKSVYLLDSRSVICLRGMIERHSEPLDPSAVFDLFEGCQK